MTHPKFDWHGWSDADLISYCESHSKTERALFHRDMVVRIHDLAAHWFGDALPEWMEVHWETMKPLVEEARRRLKKPEPPSDKPCQYCGTMLNAAGRELEDDGYRHHNCRDRLHAALVKEVAAHRVTMAELAKALDRENVLDDRIKALEVALTTARAELGGASQNWVQRAVRILDAAIEAIRPREKS